jgi:hypothetical protein
MPEARDATDSDRAAIGAALTSAFHDDPVMLYMFPDDSKRPKRLAALWKSETARALKVGAVHTTDGSVVGAAVWSAPDKWRMGGLELLGQFPLMLALGRDTPRSLGLLSKVEKVHPKEPHWYLNILGTATEHHRRDPRVPRVVEGVEHRLLQPVRLRGHRRGHDQGRPHYLADVARSPTAGVVSRSCRPH